MAGGLKIEEVDDASPHGPGGAVPRRHATIQVEPQGFEQPHPMKTATFAAAVNDIADAMTTIVVAGSPVVAAAVVVGSASRMAR